MPFEEDNLSIVKEKNVIGKFVRGCFNYDENKSYKISELSNELNVDAGHLRYLRAKKIINKNDDGKLFLGSAITWWIKSKSAKMRKAGNSAGKKWTKTDIDILLSDKSNSELSKLLGRSKVSIRIKKCRLKKESKNE